MLRPSVRDGPFFEAPSPVEFSDDTVAFLEPYDYLFDGDDGVIAFDVDGDELSAAVTAHRDLFGDRDAYVVLDDLPAELRSEVSTAVEEGSITRRRSPRIVGTAYLLGTIRAGGDDYDPTFERAGECSE